MSAIRLAACLIWAWEGCGWPWDPGGCLHDRRAAAGAVAAWDAVDHSGDPRSRGRRSDPEAEIADDLVRVVGGPALEAGLRQIDGHVHTVELEPGRCGEHAYGADDGEAHRHQGHDDGESRRDPSQVQRKAGAAGHDQVPEHPLAEVGRSRRGAQGGGDDEAEDVQHPGHQARVDVVAAGRPVGMRRKRVEQQPDDEEDRRDPDGHQDQGDHEPATLPQLHEPGGDHAAGGDPGSPPVTRHATPLCRDPGYYRLRRRRTWSSFRGPQSTRDLQEPRFERRLDLL